MAKTFKNLPAPAAKLSERDFLDLNDDPRPSQSPKKRALPKGSTGNTGNTSNTANISGMPTAPESTAEISKVNANGVRQTFVLSQGHLERLRDYVHNRRAQGDYTYSQKQALQEALDLLFAGTDPVPPRPAQAREQEQQHRERIQQGKRPATK